MRIGVDATPRDFGRALTWLGSLIGAKLVERVDTFEQHAKRNPMLASHYRDLFALEYAFVEARKYRNNTGRAPTGIYFDDLYTFAIPARRIFERLPETGKNAFAGKLRDFVSGNYGARPFAYEILMACHLMQKGWDVEFSDLCGLARFDFLARLDGIEFEMECKTTSGDAGRKIHRREVNRLADLILPTTYRLAEKAGCHLLRVTVPDRLVANEVELAELAGLSGQAATVGEATSSKGSVSYRHEALTSWPEPGSDPTAREFFEERLGVSNAHLLFHARPAHAVVAVSISSNKPDRVVGALSDEAKDAAKQCSGNRPAVIAMQLVDPIEEGELAKMLRTANGLHKIAHAVFKSPDRAHVDCVAFTVPPRLTGMSFGTRRASGPALVLHNDRRKFQTDVVRSVFRT